MLLFCSTLILKLLLLVSFYSSSVVCSGEQDTNYNETRKEVEVTPQRLRGGRNLMAYPVIIPDTADPLLSGLSIPANAAEQGMWTRVFDWPLISIHAAVMPDGKLLTYGSATDRGVQDGRKLVIWDPTKGLGGDAFSIVDNAEQVDSFCSSGVLLPDGEFLVTGGASLEIGASSRESASFNYRTESARRVQDMQDARWYGSMIKLPDGRAMTTGGGDPYVTGGFNDPIGQAGRVSSTPEVYTPGQGWSFLSGARSLDAFGAENNRYWYPRQWVSPTGTVFGISTDKMWELNPNGAGSIRTIRDFKTKPDNALRPNVGPTSSAVMYAPGKILQMGGNGYSNGFPSPSSEFATVIDINEIASNRVTVREVAAMANRRQWHNAAVLPDGKVIVTGGTRFANDGDVSNDVPQAEIWDPATEQFSPAASAGDLRVYHSVTALLPNGMLFSGGGGVPGPPKFNGELYLPPYFFRRSGGTSVLAEKPKIISMSTNALSYNSRLEVELSTQSIREVSLIAMPVVTHSFDTNQRRMTLSFALTALGASIQMPANRNLAPPGYYYLSIVNSDGVPSNAAIISIDAEAPPLPSTGTAPGPSPTSLPEITGAFTASMTGRFDDPAGGFWQRLFEYSNGPETNNILFGQRDTSRDIIMQIIAADGIKYSLNASNAIVPGEKATWNCGITNDGVMFIEKNGARIATGRGQLPANEVRRFKLLGESTYGADTPLVGSVTNFQITNSPARDPPSGPSLPEITGAFTASMTGRFVDPAGGFWQRLFEYSNGPEDNNIIFGQRDTSRDIILQIIARDGVKYSLNATNAIIPEQIATWACGITSDGTMFIEKNGVRIATGRGQLPANIPREFKLFGRSTYAADTPLIGSITNFQLSAGGAQPAPGPVPAPIPAPIPAPFPAPTPAPTVLPEITGAFTASMTGRFDDPTGGFWQRLFEYSNGPEDNNVIFGQRDTSRDIILQIIARDGVKYSLNAPNAIIPEQIATWACGITSDGTMFIEKNGVRIATGRGQLPANIPREFKLFGRSTYAADTPLIGSITNFQLSAGGAQPAPGPVPAPIPAPIPAPFPAPTPAPTVLPEITGAFTASMTGRFDDPTGGFWQRLFEYSNGPEDNNVIFGQRDTSRDIILQIIARDGVKYSLNATNAIIPEQIATWACGITSDGTMFIEKNGVRIATGRGQLPANIPREFKLFGRSTYASDTPLIGSITNFQLSAGGVQPAPAPVPAPIPAPFPAPTPAPTVLPEITGAFTASMTGRFDDPTGGFWQRLFEYSNGPEDNNVIFGQRDTSRDIILQIIARDGVKYSLNATNAIIPEEIATWACGITSDGTMFIEKNGARIATGRGQLPANIPREFKLFGRSTYASDTPLIGSITNFQLSAGGAQPAPAPVPAPIPAPFPAPTPAPTVLPEITGAFTASMTGRFDDPTGGFWQRLFEYSNGPEDNNIIFGQRDTSRDIILQIIARDGVKYSLNAPNAIIPEQIATWACGITSDGTMFIEKNGVRIATGRGQLPANIPREFKLFGRSTYAADTPLIGSITNFQLSAGGAQPAPGPVPAPIPAPIPAPFPAPTPAPTVLPEITGAFTASMTGRFDDPTGGFWQRLFEYSNGPEDNNVIFGQRDTSRDIILQIIARDGVKYSLNATNAIIPEQIATWACGITSDGTMFIEKNGARIATGRGQLPANIPREFKLFGRSTYASDTPLIGSITNFQLSAGGVQPAPAPVPAPIPAPFPAPTPAPTVLPEITGAFTASMTGRFDDPTGGFWQRLFEYSNGPEDNNVIFGQRDTSRDIILQIIARDGVKYSLNATNAIIPEQIATWACGITSDGTMFIEKNGARIATGRGQLPANIPREFKLFGRSTYAADTPLIGSITNFQLSAGGAQPAPAPVPAPIPAPFPAPTPAPTVLPEITGAFTASMTGRFDDPTGGFWQRLFEYSNGPEDNNVIFGQRDTSRDIILQIIARDGVKYSLNSPNAIIPEQIATWACGITSDGTMFIEKNGARIATGRGQLPANISREFKLFGRSTYAADTPLIGSITNFQLSAGGTQPAPAPVPAPVLEVIPVGPDFPTPAPAPLPEIRGSFFVFVVARFDNLGGGWYQRVFDFGNGSASDNVFLTQVGNSHDLALHVYTGSSYSSVKAHGVIVQGVPLALRCGVDADATMWIELDGERVGEGPGRLPRNIARSNKLIGESNWPNDTPIVGDVTNIQVVNLT